MSPEQIEVVTRTWDRAGRDPTQLHTAVMDRLPGRAPAERARWLVDCVDRLSSSLERPATLDPTATAAIARRAPATTAELAADRDAVVDAVRSLTTDFGPVEEDAWQAAFQLFDELVGPLCLDPFRTRTRRNLP